MDPTQCYHEMLDALTAGDFDAARNHALSLREWLDRSGFIPNAYSAEQVNEALTDVLRRSGADSLEENDDT
jgi:hypothetical protein